MRDDVKTVIFAFFCENFALLLQKNELNGLPLISLFNINLKNFALEIVKYNLTIKKFENKIVVYITLNDKLGNMHV